MRGVWQCPYQSFQSDILMASTHTTAKGVGMVNLVLTTDQVVELVRQLPPQQKRVVLLALAGEAQTQRDAQMVFAENRLRQRAAERGFRWDDLNDDEREAFVDELLHEAL